MLGTIRTAAIAVILSLSAATAIAAELIDDPTGAEIKARADTANVAVVLVIRNDGSIQMLNRKGGRAVRNVAGDPRDLEGGQTIDEIIVYHRNPTCVRCKLAGEWKEVCW
jgi:hypothetical protein